MNILKRLFSKKDQPAAKPQPKERPADWNLTFSDLMEEMKAGKRKSVGSPESEWAREYERSLIPPGVRFPQKGDVYESLDNRTVSYMTAWAAPFTGGGEAVLLKGERVWIHTSSRDEKPIGVYAQAVEYRQLEERMVPKEEREKRKYGGFYFYFKTVELSEYFKLVETEYTTERDAQGEQ